MECEQQWVVNGKIYHQLPDHNFICCVADQLRLKVVTIATNETDGYKRFMRSAKLFGIDVEVG